MATSKVKYLGNLRVQNTHIASGKEVITDAPLDNHGKGEAFSPTDLLCTSLASCMLTIIGISAENHSFNIDGAEVDVTKIMADSPRRVSKIIIDFHFRDNNYSEKNKKIIEYAAYNCPVILSLNPEIVKEVNFNF